MSVEPVLELRGLSKRFGPVQANRNLHLRLAEGSIHALIGENGAGKSTAMKMAFGMIRPDEGEVWVQGVRRDFRSPKEAVAAGIGMVHQHFMLSEVHTPVQNFMVLERKHWLKPSVVCDRLTKLAGLSFGPAAAEIEWDQPTGSLPVGVQQRLEILKLLDHDAKILILDEPTAVLTPQEIEKFFDQLRGLRDQGRSILIITHKLKEVMALADHVTVVRQGETVGTLPIQEATIELLGEMMVGRVLKGADSPRSIPREIPKPVLSASHLRYGKLQDLSFELRPGEILGVAGVEGNGQSELLEALLFPEKLEAGELHLQKRKLGLETPSELRSLGIGFVPEDRQKQGLILEGSILENMMLGKQEEFHRAGKFDWTWLRKVVLQLLEEKDIRPRDPDALVGSLSGGNQQKLLMAREMWQPTGRATSVLIVAQPTRGVDVGAIERIHEDLLRARSLGVGILLVSSELDELLTLSDRIVVMVRGKIQGEQRRGEFQERQLGVWMGGGV
jgi:simple sugar transport system ATP-binding protein